MTGMLRRATVATLLLAAACGGDEPQLTPSPPPTTESPPPGVASIEVTSTAFRDAQTIPVEHTCDGADASPPLEFSGIPQDAREVLLTVVDLDASGGRFAHWIVFGIDAGTPGIPEGTMPAGAAQGTNDFGDLGWGGPCPPADDPPHNYVFSVTAFSEPLGLEEGATIEDVGQARAQSRVIGLGQVTARYGR